MRRLVAVLAVLIGCTCVPAAARADWDQTAGAIAGPGTSAPSVTVDSTLRYVSYLAPGSDIRVSGDQQDGSGFTPFTSPASAPINPTPTAAIGASGTPQFTNDDGRLYVAWSQDGAGYVRSWAGADGWVPPSHNGNPPVPGEPFGSTDSVSWVADGAYGDTLVAWVATNSSGKRRIRVAYDHDTWLHTSDIALADDTDTVTDTAITGVNGIFYVAWREVHAGVARVHVATWDFDTDTWTPVGGALGTAPTLLTMDTSDQQNLTIAYYDGGNLIVQRWDPDASSWVQLGGTINTDPAATHDRPSIARGFLAYSELQTSPAVRQVKVTHWDGLKWAPTGDPLNRAAGVDARTPDIADQHDKPTVVWSEGGSIYADTLDDIPPTPVMFTSSTYSVSESAGSATITVHRTGDLSRSASFDYVFTGAREASDFAAGTTVFPATVDDLTITVPIADNSAVDGDDHVTLTLSRPGDNTVLGSPSTAVLTIVDDDLLDTQITDGPDGPTNVASPSFTFLGIPSAASFECSFDGAAYAPCTSPARPTAPLADGSHTFSVRAKDVHGVIDPSPATRTFFVDTVAPAASIDLSAGAGGASAGTGKWVGPVGLGVTSSDAAPSSGVIVSCSLDPAAKPTTVAELQSGSCPPETSAAGDHVVYGVAVDRAGNASGIVAATFRIVGEPDTTITGGPSAATWDPAPTFSFSSTFAGSTFRCRVDSGAFAPCSSSFTLQAQHVGPHAFEVAAVAPDGTIDRTPARQEFTIVGTERQELSCNAIGWRPKSPSGANGCTLEPRTGCTLAYGTCGSFTPACPVRARCTYTAKVHVDLDAKKIGIRAWTYVAPVLSAASKANGGRPDSASKPPQVALASCQQDDAGTHSCPASATGTVIGDGTAPLMVCGADSYDTDAKHPGTYGPAMIVGCEWSVTTEVAPPLATTPSADGFTTFAPGAGKVTATPAGGARAELAGHALPAKKPKKRTPAPFKAVTATATGAGPVTVTPKLSAAAKATLKKKGKLTLRVTLTFVPAGGGPTITSTVSITLVKPKPFPKKPKTAAKG